MTTRVKVQRKNGKIVNEFDVYIGRRCTMGGWNLPHSKWANPYVIGKDGDRNEVLDKYWKYLLNNLDLLSNIGELRGKKIGCFCKLDEDCHGDVLINLINGNIKVVLIK